MREIGYSIKEASGGNRLNFAEELKWTLVGSQERVSRVYIYVSVTDSRPIR